MVIGEGASWFPLLIVGWILFLICRGFYAMWKLNYRAKNTDSSDEFSSEALNATEWVEMIRQWRMASAYSPTTSGGAIPHNGAYLDPGQWTEFVKNPFPGVVSFTCQYGKSAPIFGRVFPDVPARSTGGVRCKNMDYTTHSIFVQSLGVPQPMRFPAYVFVGGGDILGVAAGDDAPAVFDRFWPELCEYAEQVTQWQTANTAPAPASVSAPAPVSAPSSVSVPASKQPSQTSKPVKGNNPTPMLHPSGNIKETVTRTRGNTEKRTQKTPVPQTFALPPASAQTLPSPVAASVIGLPPLPGKATLPTSVPTLPRKENLSPALAAPATRAEMPTKETLPHNYM